MCDNEEKVFKLNNKINKLLNIKGTVNSYLKNNKKISYIRYNKKDTIIISDKIKKYVPECMEYKLLKQHRGHYEKINHKKILRKVCKIKNKEFYKNDYCFDIQVLNNNNFIVGHYSTNNGIIVHNCHLMATNKLSGGKIKEKGKFVEFLESLDSKKVIGLTATPIQLVSGRSGSELKMMNRSMRSYWYKSDIFHATQIQDIYKDYWAEIDLEKVEINSDNKLRLNSTGNEFTTESIIKQYEDNSIDFYILEQYERLLSEGIDNILTFMPSVELAVNLAKKNPDFAVVYDKTPSKEREAIVKAFKRGDIPNLLNVNVFNCGFDHPGLKGLIMARETNSFTVYYQQFGRLVRPIISNGIIQKTQKKLIDLTGNSERFGDIRGITFEKNDYTNGWGMWNADRLLTGSPFGNWNMPHRSSFIKSGTKKESIDDIIISFGKYKGRSLEKSFRENPGYFTWILNEFNWGKHNQDLKTKIETLIKQNILHGS